MHHNIIVVGSGVVGGATGRGFASKGNHVTFVDVDEAKLGLLRNEGFTAIGPTEMALDDASIVFVSVPTPTNEHGFDPSYLIAACNSIGQALKRCGDWAYPVIVFRSTMLPGTTEKILVPQLEEVSGKKAGIHFGVCYNPEYLREYRADQDFLELTTVTIGHDASDETSAERVADTYASFGANVYHLSVLEAEWQKYVHNVFNAVKISTFNEFRAWAAALGIDPDAVERIFRITTETAESLTNPAYGTHNRGPYGGACLPKEVNAVNAWAAHVGIELPVVSATQRVNQGLGGL